MELPEIGGLEAAIGATGLILLGYLATIWSKTRNLMIKALSFVIVPQQVTDYKLSMGIQTYLARNGRRRKFGIRSYSSFLAWLRSKRMWRYIAYESLSEQSTVFWIGWRPVWFSPQHQEPKDGTQVNNPTMIRFIRWTFPFHHFVDEGLKVLNKDLEEDTNFNEPDGDFFVEYVVGTLRMMTDSNATVQESAGRADSPARSSGGVGFDLKSQLPINFSWDDIGQNEGSEAFKSLVLDWQQDRVIKEIEFWMENQTWYRDRNIPWHRGYVFYGKPGTGKSSFVRAIGQKFDLPIYVFDLASMDNQYMSHAWRSRCQLYGKRIILIEDIDGIFNGRKNIAAPDNVQGVTFDCLLNLIDGVDRTDGTLLFVTTNNIDLLDPALGGGSTEEIGSRPGRVDRVIELSDLPFEGRLKMAEMICGDLITDNEIQSMAKEYENITPASFQEICIRTALDKKWEEKNKALK